MVDIHDTVNQCLAGIGGREKPEFENKKTMKYNTPFPKPPRFIRLGAPNTHVVSRYPARSTLCRDSGYLMGCMVLLQCKLRTRCEDSKTEVPGSTWVVLLTSRS